MSGVLRIPPVLLPVLVTMTTGSPVSRSVVPLVPPLPSYSSTCSRTQSLGLGIYFAMGLSSIIGEAHESGFSPTRPRKSPPSLFYRQGRDTSEKRRGRRRHR